VVGVLRCYNNPNVVKAVKTAERAKIGKIYVVVNANPDMGATRKWLNDAGYPESEWLEIIELKDYSWSKGLNAALRCIQNHNISTDKSFKYILNFSVEALFSPEHITQMVEAFHKYENAAVVGVKFLGKKFLSDKTSFNLGRSYNHPRNTLMMMSIERLGPFWWTFDPACDELGGMEDIEFIFRMLVYTARDSVILNDIVVPLLLGKNYNQEQKEEREQSAMDQIIAKHLSPFERKPLSTDQEKLKKKIEKVITEMQLQ
jgi:hypothetical protein